MRTRSMQQFHSRYYSRYVPVEILNWQLVQQYQQYYFGWLLRFYRTSHIRYELTSLGPYSRVGTSNLELD